MMKSSTFDELKTAFHWCQTFTVSDKCEEVVESFSRVPASNDSVDMYLEASVKKQKLSPKVTANEYSKFVQESEREDAI